MRIVITGATGFIGNAVAKEISKVHDVWCTVRRSSDRSRLGNVKCSFLYVDERQALYRQMAEINPELVIHIAGVCLSEHNSDNIAELIDSNIGFPAVLFDAAYEAGCRQFINTASCWQNYQGEDYNPVNLYAATKQAAEDILKYYVRAKAARAVTLTIFDSYGPNDSRNKILNLVSRLEDGGSIGLSMGEQRMYLCYIDDIVSAYKRAISLICAMESGGYQKYAVRDEKAYTLREIIETYIKLSGKKVKILWGERAYRDREIMNPDGWGNVIPGWDIQYPLQAGMKLYIDGGEKDI